MESYIGDIIYRARLKRKITQDEYGQVYSVTGPAIFKFEKNYVRPSLKLWLLMAKDAELSERRAVLLWLKSKLPVKYQEYVEMQSAATSAEEIKLFKKKAGGTDYSKCEDRKSLIGAINKDSFFPEGLKEIIMDDETWALYKPKGKEIHSLYHLFAPLGRGTKALYRDALRMLRKFAEA